MLKVINVVGARPNFMKVAPLVDAMKRQADRFTPLVVHTGQHYDPELSQVFYDELGLPEPAYRLDARSRDVGAMQPGIASAFTEDPIDPLRKIDIPALIVAGGRDRQLARLDFLALTTADFAAKTLWLPDMNHVLVDVSDDADDLASYNQPERPLDPDLIEVVANFIQAEGAR